MGLVSLVQALRIMASNALSSFSLPTFSFSVPEHPWLQNIFTTSCTAAPFSKSTTSSTFQESSSLIAVKMASLEMSQTSYKGAFSKGNEGRDKEGKGALVNYTEDVYIVVTEGSGGQVS
jgi:hypothetical protein